MLANEIEPFMEDAVSEVLEAMCFISSEGRSDDEAGEHASDWLTGELDFVGSPSGTFGIAVPPTTAVAMAANFLGEDDSTLEYQQIAEVVGEMTNMVCGALLSHLDPKTAFTLSPPRHGCAGILDRTEAVRICTTYRLDDGFIYAWLELRDEL